MGKDPVGEGIGREGFRQAVSVGRVIAIGRKLDIIHQTQPRNRRGLPLSGVYSSTTKVTRPW